MPRVDEPEGGDESTAEDHDEPRLVRADVGVRRRLRDRVPKSGADGDRDDGRGKAEKAFVKYRKAELKKQNKAGLDVAQEILEITADVRCCAKDALDAELHKEWVEMAADEKREWRLGLLYETDDEDDVDDDRKRYKITDILPHGPAADAGLSVGDIILSTAVKHKPRLHGRRRRRAAAVD